MSGTISPLFDLDVCLSIPKPTKSLIHVVAEQCNKDAQGKLSLSYPSSYHLSICVAKGVTKEQADAIDAAVKRLHFENFTASMCKPHAFGKHGECVVFNAKSIRHGQGGQGQSEGKFIALHDQIKEVAERTLGIPVEEEFGFAPHCTIAILKPGMRTVSDADFSSIPHIEWIITQQQLAIKLRLHRQEEATPLHEESEAPVAAPRPHFLFEYRPAPAMGSFQEGLREESSDDDEDHPPAARRLKRPPVPPTPANSPLKGYPPLSDPASSQAAALSKLLKAIESKKKVLQELEETRRGLMQEGHHDLSHLQDEIEITIAVIESLQEQLSAIRISKRPKQ